MPYQYFTWKPIPTCPIVATGGPMQSNDLRYLWFWNATQICYFNMGNFQWSKVLPWDGAQVYCVSQPYRGYVVLRCAAETGYRLMDLSSGKFNLWQNYIGGIDNNEYGGTYGQVYGNTFAYDPNRKNCIISSCDIGTGAVIDIALYIDIVYMYLDIGAKLATPPGAGAGFEILPGGILGSTYQGYGGSGTIFAGPGYWMGGFTAGEDPVTYPADSVSKAYFAALPDANFCTGFGPGAVATEYPFSNWKSGLDIVTGALNFDTGCLNIASSGHGGWYNGESLLLKNEVYGSGNPSAFAYVPVIAGAPGFGDLRTFGIPFEVEYNPLGDTNLLEAGFGPNVLVGPQNSAEWFYLAFNSFTLSKRNLLNYMWKAQ